MKKIIALIILALALSLCFVACDRNASPNTNVGNEGTNSPSSSDTNNSTGEHTHTFSAWSTTVAPSCVSGGTQTRTCTSCGFSEYSQIVAFGHTEIVDSAIAATCTTDGKTEGKHCSVCNAVIVPQSTIQALGHKYNDGVIITAATCNQNGVKKFTCTVETCKHSYTEEFELPKFTATELYEQSVKYVGEIVTYDKSGDELSLGTGFVMSSDGKIITNYHVIDGAYYADITINNIKYTISSVLAYDADIDLAVLKINATELTAATICKQPVSTGSTVYAIGSSRGMTNTYSQGIVTHADRVVDGVSHIQHDASITHGNSGGPLINIYGEVIGINTWGISDSQNLNFAVFTGELDNLVYGTSMSLAEFTKMNTSPFQVLVDWVCENATDIYDDRVEYKEEDDDNEWYILTYDFEMNSITISKLSVLSNFTSWSAVTFNAECTFSDCGLFHTLNENGTTVAEVYGKLDMSTYRFGDTIPYTYFYSYLTENEDNVKSLYSSSTALSLAWLSDLTESEFDMSLVDLGFISFYRNWQSEGLGYKFNDDVTCFVSAKGTCTDTEVYIPEYTENGYEVTGIDDSAFYHYDSLISINIHDRITFIGDGAFWGCSSLTDVTISNSVTSIGSCVFWSCTSLTNIYFRGTKTQWEAITKGSDWDHNTGNYTIYCTDGEITK